jgi:hypothetical protein
VSGDGACRSVVDRIGLRHEPSQPPPPKFA